MDNTTRQFKEALDKALKPLLVGLRTDIKNLATAIKNAEEATKSVQVTNHPIPLDEVRIGNLKDYKFDLEEIVKAIDDTGERQELAWTNFGEFMKSFSVGFLRFMKRSEKQYETTKNVHVENQVEIPKVQKVEVQNPTEPVREVQITNFPTEPGEAVAVRLVGKNGKGFYELLASMTTSTGGGGGIGGGATLKELKDLLILIEANTDELEIKADSIILNTDELEALIALTNTALADIDTLITDLSKAEDSAHVSGDRGIMSLAVRSDVLAPLGEDGDYVPIQTNAEGATYVTISDIEVSVDVRSLGEKFSDADKMFTTVIDNVTITGTSETDFLLLRNALASTVDVRIRDFIAVATKGGVGAEVRVYRNPTITADGTPISINNLRDSTVPSLVTAFSAPTISDRGIKLEIFGVTGGGQTFLPEGFELQFLEGDDLLVTIQPTGNNKTFSLTTVWGEQDIVV